MNTLEHTLQNLKERWTQLSRREQYLSIVGGGAILLWLIWQMLVMPLANRQQMAENRLAANYRQLEQIKRQANQIVQLKASGSRLAPNLNTPMDRVINQTASVFQLTIERVKNRQDGLEVAMGTARFDRLMGWLIKLEQESRIQVAEIQLDSTDQPGIVEVKRLQLERL
ncbi:type II secretion system protein M [Endozoicomonas sp. Mp262]|uniref:type II secretion system protein M n=1 Tax=Endozoicomonas sp. Mp262 TaxID=2919499 RepID=UPI0021D88094